MPHFSLTGKRALITGGSSGIGLGIAREFALAGADVVLVARSEEKLAAAKSSLADTGRSIGVESFDLGQVREIEAFFRQALQRHGAPDILVNNAGTSRRGLSQNLSLDDWQAVIDLNLTAVWELSRHFAAARIAAGKPGKIVNIASLMSSASRPGTSTYTASKGGVLMLTKSLALDWASHGICVNAIGPGYVDTPLTSALKSDAAFDSWVRERVPLGRWATPADISPCALFLAAPASDFVTGQIFYVDGGFLARL